MIQAPRRATFSAERLMDTEDPSGLHLYNQAEATIEDLPLEDGGAERVVRLRFHTSLLTMQGESPSVSPWLIFPLAALDRLSEQLASLSESAKRWQPGSDFPAVGLNIGVQPTPQD